jgi:hypothetical protein
MFWQRISAMVSEHRGFGAPSHGLPERWYRDLYYRSELLPAHCYRHCGQYTVGLHR